MHPLHRPAVLLAAIVVAACSAAPNAASPGSTPPAATSMSSIGQTPAAQTPALPAVSAAPSPLATPPATPDPVAAVPHCGGVPASGWGDSFVRKSTWAGYIAADPPGVFSCVEAGWIEPVVTCGDADAAVGFWVGIGGYSSRDLGITDDGHALERAGTGVECEHGIADHYAWHQMEPLEPGDVRFAPASGAPGEMPIVAGDRMWAQVRYGDGGYVMTVANRTTGEVRSVVALAPGIQRSSADWMVGGEEGADMAEFGTVTFTECFATMDGVLGAVSSARWRRNQVDEWSNGVRRLRVSDVAPDGASFEIGWTHA